MFKDEEVKIIKEYLKSGVVYGHGNMMMMLNLHNRLGFGQHVDIGCSSCFGNMMGRIIMKFKAYEDSISGSNQVGNDLPPTDSSIRKAGRRQKP